MRGFWEPPYAIPEQVLVRAEGIRLVLLDVDGVLTDGSLFLGDGGKEYKVFNTQDGHGLKLLAAVDIPCGIITARRSAAVDQRVSELKIPYYYPGRMDKVAAFDEALAAAGVGAEQSCYVGDDLVDVPVMRRCGLAVAVQSANFTTKRVAHWVTPSDGGRGAVREVCELILYAQNKFDALIEDYLQ